MGQCGMHGTRNVASHQRFLPCDKDTRSVQRNIWHRLDADRCNFQQHIANYVQDSGSAKAIIQRHQVAIYGRRASIEVNGHLDLQALFSSCEEYSLRVRL
jgi:hypothetical protein